MNETNLIKKGPIFIGAETTSPIECPVCKEKAIEKVGYHRNKHGIISSVRIIILCPSCKYCFERTINEREARCENA